MNNYKLITVLLFCLSFSFTTQAQTKAKIESDKLSLNSGTIDNQFEYVIRRSYDYKEFKTVKKVWLYQLKAHVMDSLKAVHKDLDDTQAVVSRQAEEISKLKSNLNNTQGTLDKTNLEKDSMSLFGMQMSKGVYNGLMWSIIVVLLAISILFMYKFKNSNILTRQAKNALIETEEEFEDHRRIALEREQKVRRQLQDEIIKHKNS